jgi:transposase
VFYLPPGAQHVHMFADPISMGWSEKKLGQLCREEMGIDPEDGDVFLFHNRKKDQIRLFFLDAEGCQMLTKYLPENAFLLPVVPEGERSSEIPVTLLNTLFKNG